LRQRIKLTGSLPGRHKKFPRSLRRRFEQCWRLDLEKALLIHEHTRGRRNFAAEPKVPGHLGTAQIEVPIFQPQFLVHLAGDLRVIHRKRQHISLIQHLDCLRHDFDLARRNF
jgi:hypothetical protein